MAATVPTTVPAYEASVFAHAVLRLTADDLRRLTDRARNLDDVTWWHAVVAVDRRLRGAQLLRHATMAGRVATQAVLTAANRAGVDIDSDLLAIARAAGDAARAVVAGGQTLPEAQPLLALWADIGFFAGHTVPDPISNPPNVRP